MVDEKGQSWPSDDPDRRTAAAPVSRPLRGRVLCVGGAAVDTTFVARRTIVPGTSNPAAGSRAFGGVARNVAENLARLGLTTTLLSRVGDDESGRGLKKDLDALGIDTAGIDTLRGCRTAEYMALLEPDRNLSVGVADMAIFDHLDVTLLDAAPPAADWIFADCNCTAALLGALLDPGGPIAGRTAVDAVSVSKAQRLPGRLDGVDVLFLNLDEASAILGVPAQALAPRRAVETLMDKGAKAVVLTLGAEGLLVAEADGEALQVPAVRAEIADVTGAGDALVAATLASLLAGLPLHAAAAWGCVAATLTLERIGSTRPDLSIALLEARARQVFPSSMPIGS